MKFTCHKNTILKELEFANNFTSQRNTLTITSNVLIENYQNTLTIKATDNNMGFISSFPIQTDIPGETTVPCDKLITILKTLPDEDICFSNNENKLNILPLSSINSININIKTIDSDNYPKLIEIEETDKFFNLSQRDFFDMINKTNFSVSTDVTKKNINGVYLENKENILNMVSTDSKRLSFISKMFEQKVPDFKSPIIPVKFLNLLTQIGLGEGIFSLYIDEKIIYAQITGRELYCPLIISNFPSYERLIPQSFINVCKVKTSALLTSIIRASTFIDISSKKIFIDLTKDGILISSENDDFGDIKNVIDCEYNGEEVKITFNCNFILAAIKHIDTDYMNICFNAHTSAFCLLPEPERDYKYIIMPMNI